MRKWSDWRLMAAYPGYRRAALPVILAILCWVLAIAVLGSGVLILPAAGARTNGQVIQKLPDPTGKVIAYLVEEGGLDASGDKGEAFLYSLYIGRSGETPKFDGWYQFARWLGFEPATFVARGKYWRMDCGSSRGSTLFWESSTLLIFRFCGGIIRHFTTPVKLSFGEGKTRNIHIKVIFDNKD